MSARYLLLLGTACAALAAWFPSAPTSAQPAVNPPFRVHIDSGYHVGRVEYLRFRNNDTELVSVGSDRAVRVWDLKDPDKPRAAKAFFFPDIPSAASLCANKGERYLACGFYRRDGTEHVSVRVIDLDGARADGAAPHHEVKLPATDKFGVVTGLCFDHTGEHLVITGAAGELWHWHGVDWAAPKDKPVRVVVPPMKGYTVNAAAFHPKRQLLAVGGFCEEDGPGKRVVCVTPLKDGKLEAWETLELPGTGPYVYALDWHAEYGLAVGYCTQEPDRLARARVVVYPPDGLWVGPPLEANLGVGYTRSLAWAPGGTLVATVAQDGNNPLPPEFLKVEKGRLVRLERDDVFPGLDGEPVRKTSGSGLNICATGSSAAPLSLAWAGYAHGRIELARVAKGKGTLVALDTRTHEGWYTRLHWHPPTGTLGLASPTTRRAVTVREAELWAGVGLQPKGELAGLVWHNPLAADTRANPVACVAKFGEGRTVACDSGRMQVAYYKGNVLVGKDEVLLPNVRSVLAFEKSECIVTLQSGGELGFWKYLPEHKGKGHTALERVGTAVLKDERLAYATPNAESRNWDWKPVVARKPEETVFRTYPEPGADDPRPAHVVSGLDADVVLPPGKHTFQVRVPHAGRLVVQVSGTEPPRDVFDQKVTAGTTTVAKCQFTAADPAVTVTLYPAGSDVGMSRTHSVQFGDPGRIVLFDVTPQQEKFCTEIPKPKAPPVVPHTPTADKLAAVLKALTGRAVARHTAASAPKAGMPVTATPEKAEAALEAALASVDSNDCFVLLLKGHGDIFPLERPRRVYFQADDFDVKTADVGGETGISPKRLSGMLERIERRTSKVIVILDCCKAEDFLDTLHTRSVSFYPCALRGNAAEATVLPVALDRLLKRRLMNAYPAEPGELVTQSDLLQAIREECFGYARERNRGDEWGYGAVRERFVIAHVPR